MKWILLILVFSLKIEQAFARFVLNDVKEVDREDRYGTETFSDFMSYRYPVNYQSIWDSKLIGYRVSAGSLDSKRFHYLEDIKLQTDPMAKGAFSFTQMRDEDRIEQKFLQEVRLSWRPTGGPFQVSMMGDGGFLKSYGDVGGALAYYPNSSFKLEGYYWSVDHYYEEKRDEEEGKRTKQTWTAGILGFVELNAWRLSGQYEYDAPLSWHRENFNYDYDYDRKSFSAELQHKIGPEDDLFGRFSEDLKNEGKMWYLQGQHKRMERQTATQEIEWYHRMNKEFLQVILLRIERNTFYDDSLKLDVEEHSPTTRRREFALFTAWNQPFENSENRYQLALNIDPMEVREGDEKTKNNDLKFQTAFDISVATGVRCLLNMTWDLDQIYADYPYKDKPAKPWGGGNLQIVAVF